MVKEQKERKPKGIVTTIGFLMGKTIEIYETEGNLVKFTTLHNGKTRIGVVLRDYVQFL